MLRLRSIPVRVGWRLAVTLLTFNPTGWSVYHLGRDVFERGAWDAATGAAILVCVGFLVAWAYMAQFVIEFRVASTFVGLLCLTVVVLGHTPFGWWDATSMQFGQWAIPLCLGLILCAGPVFNIIRRRDSAMIGVDDGDY